jgi:hypothetical protein
VGFRQCLFGLQRVVDDDDVGAPPGQHPAARQILNRRPMLTVKPLSWGSSSKGMWVWTR